MTAPENKSNAPSPKPKRRRPVRAVLHFLAIHLGAVVLKALMATWRVEIPDDDMFFGKGLTLKDRRPRPERVVGAFWHNRMLGFAHIFRHRNMSVMISRHGDGEVIAHVVKKFGIDSVRGSSTRGGRAALKAAIDNAATSDVCFTPDGPRGPRYRVQPGVILAASVTGHPLMYGCFGCSSAWVFKTWDRFMVPKPFAKLVFAGGGMTVGPNLDAAGLEAARLELERRMREQAAEVDRLCGSPPDPALAEKSTVPS